MDEITTWSGEPLTRVQLAILCLACVLFGAGLTLSVQRLTTADAAPSASPASTTPTATPVPAPTPTAAEVAPTSAPLDALVAELTIVAEHLDGYDRDLFPHWIDADGDGCNARYEVLIAEAIVPPTVSGTCDLTGGSWLSPYDGVRIDDARGVQIDHVVALAEAWYSGAYAWTTERRTRFANDVDVPWVLNAVSPKANESKGSNDPAEWLPPLPSAICPYIESWIGTKLRWALAVDAAEKAALDKAVAQCPDSAILVPKAAP